MVLSKPIKLNNLVTGEVFYDTLHATATKQRLGCTRDICQGSSMTMYDQADKSVTGETLLCRAEEYMRSFYKEHGRTEELDDRWAVVRKSIEDNGTYSLTEEELAYAATTAWRNSPRCPGRIQWKNLRLFDCREMTELNECFEQICQHIIYSTNEGNIKPAITVFPERIPGQPDKIRVWNGQIIMFAGYEQEDGSIIGDPVSKDFTKFCQRLGWKGGNGMHDVLPIVMSGPDKIPQFFELPREIVKTIKITHPTIPAIGELGMEWFALPGVSARLFEAGGIQFPAAPFSGWYSLPEVGTRNLLDRQRYNMSEEIGRAMGLDVSTNTSLWKDKVNTECNVAVLHSFMKAGVAMVDQHTQSEQCMEHFRREHQLRGGCPTDWVWVNPPDSGSINETFHQESLNYQLFPAYLLHGNEKLHLQHKFPGDKERVSFKAAVYGLIFYQHFKNNMLMKRPKANIWYATETGSSKRYAENVAKILSSSHDLMVSSMKDIQMQNLQNSIANDALVIFVVSTFGNGDPPSDARKFTFNLEKVPKTAGMLSPPLANLNYAVFGLGSTAYENFCAYGKRLDKLLHDLGGTRMAELGICDELTHPDKTYRDWAKIISKAAGQSEEDIAMQTGTELMIEAPNKARKDFCSVLVKREIVGSAGTMILTFSFKNDSKFVFGAGDHIGIIPPPITEGEERPRERWYSLASLPYQGKDGTTLFDLVVSQLRYTTTDGCERRGLCTSYLHDVPEGSEIHCRYRNMPTLREITTKRDQPILLIANGSGIAPMRPIWQMKKNDPDALGDITFLYGCRMSSDNLFDEESNDLVDRKVAYSREILSPKTYVQDLVKKHAQLIWNMIFVKGGSIMVCGKSEMADEVKNSLRIVINLFMEKDPNNNNQSPESLLESLKIEGRYEEEIFASKKSGENEGGITYEKENDMFYGDATGPHSHVNFLSDSEELDPLAGMGSRSSSVCMKGLGRRVSKLFLSLNPSSGSLSNLYHR